MAISGGAPSRALHYGLSMPTLPLAQTVPVTRTIVYSYDGLQRLTGAIESGATTNTYAYGYDNAGNRTSATVNGMATTRSYNAANQVSGWTYDAVGNLTNDGTSTYAYDALSRLTSQGTTSNDYTAIGHS